MKEEFEYSVKIGYAGLYDKKLNMLHEKDGNGYGIYPTKIIYSDSALYDKDNNIVLSIKHEQAYNSFGDGQELAGGWGVLKALPAKGKITWYSFAEDRYWQVNFDLDYQKIVELFNQQYFSTYGLENNCLDTIILNIAPGGIVYVWVAGVDRQEFIGEYKVKTTDYFHQSWEDFCAYDLTLGPFEPTEHDQQTISKKWMEESIKQIQQEADTNNTPQNGEYWHQFLKNYHWKLKLIDTSPFKLLYYYIEHINKDGYTVYSKNELAKLNSHYNARLDELSISEYMDKPPPLMISMVFQDKQDKLRRLNADFDAFEMIEKFKKLSNEVNTPLDIIVDIADDCTHGFFNLTTKNGKKSINVDPYNAYYSNLTKYDDEF